MIYYTYIYYDPSRDNEPFYVGKGKENRAWSHLRSKRICPFVSRLKSMKKNNIKPVIGLYSGLEEEFAHLLEQELISKFGRKDLGNGPLLNLTDGGEGASGIIWSKERKDQWSMNRIGEKNPMSGKKQSDAAKNNIGKSQPKIRVYTDDTRKKQTTRQTGNKNVMFGKLPKNTIPIIYNGKEYKSIKEAAIDNGILYQTFWKQIRGST